MRCLQCGSQLALLKKLTDGEFCSAEHRTLFYDIQQKLIIERLAESARKLRRYKTLATPDPIAAATKAERLPPFAAVMPEAVLETLKFRNFRFALLAGISPVEAGLLPILPALRKPDSKWRTPLAGPAFDFPGAKTWNRPRMEWKAGIVGQMRPLLPVMPGLDSARKADEKSFQGQLSDFARIISPPNSPSGDTGAQPLELVASPCAAAIPTFHATASPLSGLGSLGRAFRVRPRGPVQDSHVPKIHEIKATALAEFEQIEAGFVWERLSRPAAGKLSPGVIGGCIPNLPGPVEAQVVLSTGHCGPDLSQLQSRPLVPVLQHLALGAGGPAFCHRPFRPRPRAGVMDKNQLTFERIDPGSGAAIESEPILCGLLASAIGDPAPPLLVHLYRMRPRGAVQGNRFAAFHPRLPGSFEPDAVPFTPSAAMPSMPAMLMRQSRPSIRLKRDGDRPPRMRPPGPKPGSGLKTFNSIDEDEMETRVPRACMSVLANGVLADGGPLQAIGNEQRSRLRTGISEPRASAAVGAILYAKKRRA